MKKSINNFFNTHRTTNIFYGTITIFVLMLSMFFVKNYTTHYTMDAIVIGVENNKVLIEDDTNNIWEFEGTDYTLNDVVAVTFYTNETDNTRDDDIITQATVLYHYKSINK